jgi:hypothetical protein
MRHEPQMQITCDGCQVVTDVPLRATTDLNGKWNESDVEYILALRKWVVKDGKEYCPTCQEKGVGRK